MVQEELAMFRRALETVYGEGRRFHDARVPAEQAAAQANLGEFAAWSVPEMIAPGALRRVYAELDGQLR